MSKKILLSWLLIIFLAFFSVFQTQPPAVQPLDAPLTEFSASRALKHLEVIAEKPHPIGSAANQKVRDYLVRELTHLGLNPQIQTTTAINSMWDEIILAGTVNNIIAKLEGTENTENAILLAAHYDSEPNSLGASDDGAAVAAILETIRALKASLPLKNDVIVLFTDGEEVGLLGAKAFVERHPWAKYIKLAVNFEARGTSGASFMFETSKNNDWLIQEFAKLTTHPFINSFASSLANLLPNETDMTIFKKVGLAGLNFAYINDSFNYHSALDNLDNLDRRSLQHHGNYALAIARHFGNLNLETQSKVNAIYFDLFGLTLIHYSEAWVIPLAILVILLFILVVILGFRQGQLTFSGITWGFLAWLFSMICAEIAILLTWWGICKIHDAYNWSSFYDYSFYYYLNTYNSNFYISSFVALTLGISSGIYIWLSQKLNGDNLAIGATLWWLILAILSSWYLPGTSYLFTLPLLFRLIGFIFTFKSPPKELISWQHLIIISFCTIPGIVLLIPTIYLAFIALTVNFAALVIILLMLLLGLLIPHFYLLDTPPKWILPTSSLLVSIILIIIGLVKADFNANHPLANSIFYELNADTNEAAWVSFNAPTDKWTSQFFVEDVKRGNLIEQFDIAEYILVNSEYYPPNERYVFKVKAPLVSLNPPTIEIVNERVNNETRTLDFHISSPQKTRVMNIYLNSPTTVLVSQINGQIITDPNSLMSNELKNQWRLQYQAFPDEGIDLTLVINSGQPISIKLVEEMDGFPQILETSLEPRTNAMMQMPFAISDLTLLSKSFKF
ncbi:MAG: M20/M25/M40 family metallo-hydrolase [Kamptonema sp. SIO1D9]|nr:M20/M25/M40 family metallo-hydrolase [Kamptonema sp. SIO1D9]